MQSLEKFCNELITLIQKCSKINSNLYLQWKWIEIIVKFFQIQKCKLNQTAFAIKIQRQTKKFLKIRKQREIRRMIYKQQGYITEFSQLPFFIQINIFRFLNLQERAKLQRVSRDFKEYLMHPGIMKNIDMFPLRKILPQKAAISILKQAVYLQSLSIKFFAHFQFKQVLEVLVQNTNPQLFKKLYLDGCENIQDSSLATLVQIQIQNFQQDQQQKQQQQSKQEPSQITGSLQGLSVLSIAENRKISDASIKYITRGCPNLEELTLLGCFGINDNSVNIIINSLPKLRKLDLGGTSITGQTIEMICNKIEQQEITKLQYINIMGCKKLNNYQLPRIQRTFLQTESGEDVFRFHLIPTEGTSLPKVTNSLLKTRSTLSMHRVYRYLLKKLNLDQQQNNNSLQEDGVTNFVFADSVLEISCFGTVLRPDQTLRQVLDQHWSGPAYEEHLTLTYKLKSSQDDQSSNDSNKAYIFAKKSGNWLPDHLCSECHQCQKKFTLFNRKHHCRNCGLIFCNICSGYRMKLPKYGYQDLVRVCVICKISIKI